ncbi:MAG: ADP-glyceromanno-heptose 6-epimerase [Caulobacteraceae bacterium]
MSGLTLVTGAAGFIGSNLARMLAEEGSDVVACDWFGHGAQWTYLADVRLHDVIRPEHLSDWLAGDGRDVETIIHMGAISATTETDVDRIVALNIRATLDLWRAATERAATFIYASSAATYGDGASGFQDNDSEAGLARLRPLNAYGWSKQVADRRFAHDAATGRPTPPKWAGLKFFNVYGPNEAHKQGMRSVVHQIYPLAARGETVSLFKSDNPAYGDGGQLRDFIYVKDICAIVRSMLAAPRLSGIYNAGTGQARSFEDLAKAVFAAVGRPAAISYRDMPSALKGKYQYFTEADVSKLRADGLAPNFHDLEDGVADYVRHLALEFGA